MTGKQLSSTHPPLLPTTEEDTVNRLRLLRSRRVGVATYHRLLAEHGSAADALRALPDVAKSAGVSSYEICSEGVVLAELKAGKAAGAQLVVHGSPAYPSSLYDIADAPPLMWVLGQTALLQKPMIALVGARNASSLGTRMAKRLAEDLTKAGFAWFRALPAGLMPQPTMGHWPVARLP